MAETFLLTQSQFDQIEAAFDAFNGNYADMYELVYDALLGQSALPDASGNPVLAEGNVQAWFGAAVEANRGEGASSTLIRVYTQAQIELRSGQAMADPQGAIQAASNAIAVQVFRDIQGSAREFDDGQTYYAVPDVFRIGDTDAAEAVANLANFDPSMWSGNPLFIGLGIEDFWIQNLLADTSSTYDVFAAIEALRIAGFATLNQVSSILGQFTSQGSGGLANSASALSAANTATQTFLDSAYDLGEIPLATLSSSNISLGSDNFDGSIESNGFSSDTFMHAGLGNDTLVGSLGRDILDGGEGNDSVSFEDVSLFGGVETIDLTASIYTRFSDVQFAATVVGDGIVSQIYDVENLALGLGDDVLEVQRLAENNTSLTRIVGSGNGQRGDTIDFSDATFAATASLKDGTATLAETNKTLEVFEFENLVGSANRDVLEGDDAETGNKIDGGGDRDTIFGLGGNDYLRGGNGWDFRIDGGEGNDIIEAGNGGDRSFGGAGDDLIFTNKYNRDAFYSGEDKVWGGAGNDIIIGDDGVDIINGGAQHDLIIGGAGADKLDGQWGHDYIIAEGADEIRGGGGNDIIDATADNTNVTVYFDANGGHDTIKTDEDGDLVGVERIVFEGISSSDVRLIWDFEITSIRDESIAPAQRGDTDYCADVNGDFVSYRENYEGAAAIEVISTGATINIGRVIGDYGWLEIWKSHFSDGYYLDFYTDGWRSALNSDTILQFDDIEYQSSEIDGEYIPRSLGVETLIHDEERRDQDGDGVIEQLGEYQSFGLFGFRNETVRGSVDDFDDGLANFSNRFNSDFVADDFNFVTSNPADLASVLSEDTLLTLTDDIFALA